jgi:ATP dependent DNA ligase C terminal region
LWDWGFEAPVKQDLMGAVMNRAKQVDSGDKSLEEAVGDFAGNAGVDGEPVEPEKPRDKTDCVILGYQLDRDGRLETLILGAAHGSKLIVAGRVRPEMEEETRSQLLMSLAAIKRNEPFVVMEADATWVEPKIACRVTYGEKLKGGALRDVQWDSLLGTMRSSK